MAINRAALKRQTFRFFRYAIFLVELLKYDIKAVGNGAMQKEITRQATHKPTESLKTILN